MRAALYARYSSDLQSEHSIEDQIALCRKHVSGLGGTVVAEYSDAAISGATLIHRPSVARLLEDAAAGQFDAVVAESLDRLSRDQEDIAALYKRLCFLDVAILTVGEGEISELHVGLKGTMNALFLKDLAAKVRRGQMGRVRAGKSVTMAIYGYDLDPKLDDDGRLMRGRRKINDAEAEVVRRIFTEYAAGATPREIAVGLNAAGIPAPRGGLWTASTIAGSPKRHTGILSHELYIGRLVYNRTTWRRNPVTGRHVARPNDPDDFVTGEAPDLRILDQDLWQRAQARRAEFGGPPKTRKRRPRHLLSGLVFCGACGGPFTSAGRGRFSCAARRLSGACTNKNQVVLDELEATVVDGISDEMLSPDTWNRFVETVRAEHSRQARAARRRLGALNREAADVKARIGRLLDVLETGEAPDSILPRLRDLETRQAEIEAERQLAQSEETTVVDLHPRLTEAYRSQIEAMAEALKAGPERRREAAEILRDLIDRIVIYPGPHGRPGIEIESRITALAAYWTSGDPDHMLPMEEVGSHYTNKQDIPPLRLRLG